MISEKEREAAVSLLDQLESFYEESIVDPIEINDPLHVAFCEYREVTRGGNRTTDDSSLFNAMLDCSRYKSGSADEERKVHRDAQAHARTYYNLLKSRYAAPGSISGEITDKLTPAQLACANSLTDKPQRTGEIADAAGLKDASTARKALPALARMNPPLAQKVPGGYVRPRRK